MSSAGSPKVDEPSFGANDVTRAFGMLHRYPPLSEVFAWPGRWSELLNRVSRATTLEELSEPDRRMLLAAERAAVAEAEGVSLDGKPSKGKPDAPKPTDARRKGGRRVRLDRQE